jgi:DNA invertase Pin-like site-specific DNA recombinase
MGGVGAYARYSDDQRQHSTSIEDQLRVCRKIAEKEGLTINEDLVFVDEGITGKSEGRSRRTGYQRMVDAIEAGVCTVVITDEVSRLTRTMYEGSFIIELVEQRGLRIISGDGVDSLREGWKQHLILRLMVAVHEVDSTSKRTTRGMLGALHRGFMIAQPPFGYRAVREHSKARGAAQGTKWVIHEEEAAVVRRVYAARRAGMSLAQIASMLMRDGVPVPIGRDGTPSYWRPGRIAFLLRNPVYRGTFVWNGSSFTRAQARKRRKQVIEQEFPRPELRIVSDDLWHACNPSARNGTATGALRAPRGGGRHLLSGLVRCGDCQALLTVSGGPRSYGIHCAQCDVAVRVGARETWVGYSSAQAARLALEWALVQLFDEATIAAFRRRLKECFEEGPQREERDARLRVQRLEATVERLTRLALNPAVGIELFEAELAETASQLRVARRRLEVLTSGERRITPEQLRAQLEVDPLPLLRKMLDGGVEAYRARATLRRLLERFEFVSRPHSGVSVFQLTFRPGVCVAELTASEVIDTTAQSFEVVVKCGKARPTRWTVSGRPLPADCGEGGDCADGQEGGQVA